MRTPRIVILAAFICTTIILASISLRPSRKGSPVSTKNADTPAGFQALFSFNTPLSLFPPNAIISLTDDNTTYFLARPAAFGPLLPVKGLDGELWIGSGFGADSLRRGGIIAGAEGELGCSDVPGWVDEGKKAVLNTEKMTNANEKKLSRFPNNVKNQNRRRGSDDTVGDETAAFGHLQAHQDTHPPPAIDDGTDDYLHHHLVDSKTTNLGKEINEALNSLHADHADIQSIQEGAEIAGKVVLLSRGGCGFLEKVKWVQRRGGIALIVGDDTKGGQLIQMYARGDTANVTIPSVFTSWTTAHLLSKLIPPGSVIDDVVDEHGNPTKRRPKKSSAKPSKHKSQPLSDPSKLATKGFVADEKSAGKTFGNNWFGSWFSRAKPLTKSNQQKHNRKDWMLVDDWEEKIVPKATGKEHNKPDSTANTIPKDAQPAKKDDFVIGEQDWRDTHILEGETKLTTAPGMKGNSIRVGKTAAKATNKATTKYPAEVKGGSITPGSGQYRAGSNVADLGSKSGSSANKAMGKDNSGLLTKIFGDDEDESDVKKSAISPVIGAELERNDRDEECDHGHEGLWVTITPTSGSSPFFDTLLVLVVSPLITLSIVYALLLIRSRIRRRRWRAPKSVVERLPVRTYQTLRSTGQTRLPSPTTPSVTTPLLQDSTARPRPRSQTTSGIPEPGELFRTNSGSSQISRAPPSKVPSKVSPENDQGVASEWRKYMGKQVECVVCLEEYIDGVSRVMSLPCGHEFHVDCITPWLTTRRRTCPICKGDVVRSLARGSPSTPRYDAYHDDSDDDIQARAAESVNTSPAAALPIPTNSDRTSDDLEQGIVSPTPFRTRRFNQVGSWRSLLSSSIGSLSRSPRHTPEDRSR